MADHFPHCSAGRRGVGLPTVTAEVSFQANEGRLPKDASALLVAPIFAPEKFSSPSYQGSDPMVLGWERNSTEP